MAKTTLPTNYVDDVLNGAMDGKRRYREIPNADGTISLEDATTYDQIGNNFGASQVNLMNDNINQSFDANKMLKTMDEVNAVEQEGYGVDALVVKELNSSLPKFKHGTCTIVVNTNNYKDGEVIFDSPFEKVPLLLGNIIDPSCTPHLEVTGVNFYSITQNGFKFRLYNAYGATLTITINWVAIEF